MSAQLADRLLCSGVPESKKLEMIYRRGASSSVEDFRIVLEKLRPDSRYYRLTAAWIDASKSVKLATEELFSGNAISPEIVAGFKWLYTTENKGFITEEFVKNTLPFVSVSCQKRILSKISKWVTDTELGDRLWNIVRLRSVTLSSMLLGACSNDLILREIMDNGVCLELAQMLAIIKKRFDSGFVLLQKLADCGKLSRSRLDKSELYSFILKKDLEKGIEFLLRNELYMPIGSKLSRKLVLIASTEPKWQHYLLNMQHRGHQKTVARYASPELYFKCFLKRFDSGKTPNHSSMLWWLKHLKDGSKLEVIELWFRETYGSSIVDTPKEVPRSFLFLLDDKTLKQVVEQRIALKFYHENGCRGSCECLLKWQSMFSNDKESFAFQLARLKGESDEATREIIYNSMLDSVFVLKRPQYLAKRLRFLVSRTRNDNKMHIKIMHRLVDALAAERLLLVTEGIWSSIKELVSLQVVLRNEHIPNVCINLLIIALEKVGNDQQVLLLAVMDELNKIFLLADSMPGKIDMLSKEKRRFFWIEAMSYREGMEQLSLVPDGVECPYHLQLYLVSLGGYSNDTKDLVSSFPNTLRALKYLISPEVNLSRFKLMYSHTMFDIYQLIKPLMSANDPLHQELMKKIQHDEAALEVSKVLKAFRKSKVVTKELLPLYGENSQKRSFLILAARSLLHADLHTKLLWTAMMQTLIATCLGVKGISKTLDLLLTIGVTSWCKAYFANLYPTSSKFNAEESAQNDGTVLKQIKAVKSLRNFADAVIGLEILLPFMVGDYLKPSLGSFHYYVSRLPVVKVAGILSERALIRQSAVSPRKIFLHAFFENTFMFDDKVVSSLVQQLSVKDEDDDIKREVLAAVYNIVKIVGEDRAWPQLKICLDSIGIGDRTSFTKTLAADCSIDKHLPMNIEYLMHKVMEFAESETYHDLYFNQVLKRISGNLNMLSAQFIFTMFKRIHDFNWHKRQVVGDLAKDIVFYCIPDYMETLRDLLVNFGETEETHLLNLYTLATRVGADCLKRQTAHPEAVIDFLIEVFAERSDKHFIELQQLELIRAIIDLVPEKSDDEDVFSSSLPTITSKAVEFTAELLEKFGKELFPVFVHNLKTVMNKLFSDSSTMAEAVGKLLQSNHEGMSCLELMIYFKLFGIKELMERRDEIGQLFGKHNDVNVRRSIRFLLIQSCLRWYWSYDDDDDE